MSDPHLQEMEINMQASGIQRIRRRTKQEHGKGNKKEASNGDV